MLMVEEWEGTDCRIPVMLHRVISIDGYSIETSYDMGPCRDYKQAEFFLENKWYPGCNDYPLGEDFDYSKSKIETVAEWITGPFKESRSNAALIAAAPEMYKILDNFIGCVENDSSEDFLYKYRDIKQLLARARGEN